MLQRVERQYLKKSQKLWDLCFRSKNLFNQANFQIRQKFFNKELIPNFYNLDKLWRLEVILLQATEIYLEDEDNNY